MRLSVNNPPEDVLVGASLHHRAGTFRVSKDGETLETVSSTDALEDFGQTILGARGGLAPGPHVACCFGEWRSIS
jgi:hypothetical protein